MYGHSLPVYILYYPSTQAQSIKKKKTLFFKFMMQNRQFIIHKSYFTSLCSHLNLVIYSISHLTDFIRWIYAYVLRLTSNDEWLSHKFLIFNGNKLKFKPICAMCIIIIYWLYYWETSINNLKEKSRVDRLGWCGNLVRFSRACLTLERCFKFDF